MTSPLNEQRPDLDRLDDAAKAAVDELRTSLQRGLDEADADAYDRMFAGDILWDRPRGWYCRATPPSTTSTTS